jgi:phenylalanyl-tRNA synthetase beta chain
MLTGLGFIETQSLTLTSERDHYQRLGRAVNGERVTLANPISVDQTMLREHLYSGLLDLLSNNTDQPLPQKVFEIGDVAVLKQATDNVVESHVLDPSPVELRCLAGVISAARTGYAEGRAVLDSILDELGNGPDGESLESQVTFVPVDNPSGLPGRCAEVNDTTGRKRGELFEVHPKVLDAWRLENPVVAFSLILAPVQYYCDNQGQ